jgi:hypothetical protein
MSKDDSPNWVRRVLLWVIAGAYFALIAATLYSFGCQYPGAEQNWSVATVRLRTTLAQDHRCPAAGADCIQAYEAISPAQSYIPVELQRILVCITIQFNVSHGSWT